MIQQPPPVPTASIPVQKTSGLAIAALVCGILSILGGAILILPLLLAIILGHVAVIRCGRDRSLGGMGLAITGLVLGYVSIFVVGLMAAMAIPAFQKVREASMQKTMANDARQIALAAQQVLIENGDKPVSFSIDPATGAISGPLAVYVATITPGTTAVDSTLENMKDGFSLQHPKTYGGAEIRFDAEGRKVGGP